MGSMKVTVNLAMRARDVSRPRPEHLAEAEAREEKRARRASPATERNDAEIKRVARSRRRRGRG